jgi:hypothetical protein
MVRELEFLRERDKEDLRFIAAKGWSDNRLTVVFVLNSIYQLCIGPIYSSALVSRRVGGSIPLHYGEQIFDLKRSRAVRRMAYDYAELASKLGITTDLLTQNTCGDIVYRIARNEQEQEGE